MVPASEGVSVTYYLTPPMTHRQYVYEFPNPWESVNYGMNDDRANPATVQWLVLDAATLGQPEQALFSELTGAGGFRIVYSDHGVMVAHRAAP
jgi:hypothetical protein